VSGAASGSGAAAAFATSSMASAASLLATLDAYEASVRSLAASALPPAAVARIEREATRRAASAAALRRVPLTSGALGATLPHLVDERADAAIELPRALPPLPRAAPVNALPPELRAPEASRAPEPALPQPEWVIGTWAAQQAPQDGEREASRTETAAPGDPPTAPEWAHLDHARAASASEAEELPEYLRVQDYTDHTPYAHQDETAAPQGAWVSFDPADAASAAPEYAAEYGEGEDQNVPSYLRFDANEAAPAEPQSPEWQVDSWVKFVEGEAPAQESAAWSDAGNYVQYEAAAGTDETYGESDLPSYLVFQDAAPEPEPVYEEPQPQSWESAESEDEATWIQATGAGAELERAPPSLYQGVQNEQLPELGTFDLPALTTDRRAGRDRLAPSPRPTITPDIGGRPTIAPPEDDVPELASSAFDGLGPFDAGDGGGETVDEIVDQADAERTDNLEFTEDTALVPVVAARPRAAAVQFGPGGEARILGVDVEASVELGDARDYGESTVTIANAGFGIDVVEYESELEELGEDEGDEPSMPLLPATPIPEAPTLSNRQLQDLVQRAQRTAETDLGEAVLMYSDALDVERNNMALFLARGKLWLDLGDYARAMSDFLRAEDNAKDNPDVKVAMGDLFFARKDYRKAISYFDAALEMAPRHGMAFCRRGISFYYRKQYKEALDDLTRAQAIDPGIPTIKAYISRARKRME
jgi:hypothetical protein